MDSETISDQQDATPPAIDQDTKEAHQKPSPSELTNDELIKIIDDYLPSFISDTTATETCDTSDLNTVDLGSHLEALISLDRDLDHKILLAYTIRWLSLLKHHLDENLLRGAISDISERTRIVLASSSYLLEYVSNILDSLNYISSLSLSKITEVQPQQDCQVNIHANRLYDGTSFNLRDDDEEDGTLDDDSDDESLCNRLCTFTLTQKEFVNQHWYHCHTCNMVDRVGVCTICAKVCHKDHDVSYAKFGAFFCDCAGSENSNCMALVKRPVISEQSNSSPPEQISKKESDSKQDNIETPGLESTTKLGSTRDSSVDTKKANSIQQQLVRQIEPRLDEMLEIISETNAESIVYSYLTSLIPAYIRFARDESHSTRSKLWAGSFLGKNMKRKKPINKVVRKTSSPGSNQTYPVDFFENLQLLNEIEFGGADILSVYSTQQVKTRLNSPGMHITCTKTSAFSIDITNSDPNMVICGVRVQVGGQELTRSPLSVEIFGRSVSMIPVTPRWYDLPMTREESIQAEKRMSLSFEPSPDPTGITIIDSIKVYGKTKENFSWPVEGEEPMNCVSSTSEGLLAGILGRDSGVLYHTLLMNSLGSLQCCLNLNLRSHLSVDLQENLATELSTSLLTVPYSSRVIRNIKSLLLTIYQTRQNYIQHRDSVALNYISSNLAAFKQEHIDGELFSRIVYLMKQLCQSKLSNLTKLSECVSKILLDDDPSQDDAKIDQLIIQLNGLFMKLHSQQPRDTVFNYEDTLQPLIELFYMATLHQIEKESSSSSNSLESVTFSTNWSTMLCEYLMIPIPSHIKKHVRKLLTCICGSKDKYRQLRDFHFLESHMRHIKQICGNPEASQPTNVPDDEIQDDVRTVVMHYESMTSLVEHLKACIEIAQNRCINWQIYCSLKDQSLLAFLVRISLNSGDDVSPIVLELLQHAISSAQLSTSQTMANLLDAPLISTTISKVIEDQAIRDTLTSESLSANLAQQFISSISRDLLTRFVQGFLLETNITSLRWQAHSLLYNLWTNFSSHQQLDLVQVLWSLWPYLPKFGSKAAQFVDLVAFFTLRSQKSSADYDRMFCSETLNVLRQQNDLLIHHPNAHIYSSIQGLIDLDSYYLESEPCSVCNSLEVSYNIVKLSSIKVDSRFTTTTQIIKLIGGHSILKFSLRISDIKRSKMIKTVCIYYNNRSVQSVVELKNKTGIWNLAGRFPLSPGQSDVKIKFTLPIVACNLLIEFSEFYENFQAPSETLQCPRCSTSVSANPGVCSNCGENVFQCHKCRAINYDERDPFLCVSCGFCKYARFDISLTAKPTSAVDPIETEEDRKKTVASISNLLDKADRVYKNLMQNKPSLELLLLRIHDQVLPDRHMDDGCSNLDSHISINPGLPSSVHSMQAQSIVVGYAPSSVSSNVTSSVNKAIQHLAQKYCVECKGLFEDLSQITHKVLASRRELVEYDNRQLKRCLNAGSSVLSSANRRKSRVYSSLTSGSGRCYGCATATIKHCITMLKALATMPKYKSQIFNSGIINELVNFNLKNGSSSLSHEVRQLLCLLTRDDLNSTSTLIDLLMEKVATISKQDYQPFEIAHIVRHEIALLSVTLDSDDQCWELRLRCLIKIFAFAFELKNPTVMECLVIPCLKLLLSIIRPPTPTTRRHKDKSLENIASVRSDNYRSRVLLEEWLHNSAFIFDDWRKRAARPANIAQGSRQLKPVMSITHRASKSQHRSDYLAEKYGNKWRLKCSKFNKICMPIATLPNGWLKRLIFNRASKAVRLMSKSLVEALFCVQSRRKDIVDLLTSYLGEIGPAGECAQEFYHMYKNIILLDHWRYYLALQGILFKIGGLITQEIDKLQELEETTLNSSLSLGYSLKMLVELFSSFVAVPKIRANYKSKLVGFVLKGYLSLRKLVVQRTKVIDQTQEMLLELLEGMTSSSETETAAFITVCVEAIKNCHESDIRTPVFIFERLCSTIHPEENVHSEFFVSLEKDPQQEDYLQGRMLGNPYSSNEPGIGPLMKDIKNKICQDCELLALLEDHSSMELLVSNKIISLDLAVRDVYKQVWCQENHKSDAMRIVYRMRGLLGDATEEFIESFDLRNNEEVDEEEVFKMANIMSTSGGLEVMLQRLDQIYDLSPPFRPLLDVILKLFIYCTKTRTNRLKLLTSEFKTVETLLSTLKLALNDFDFLNLAGLKEGISSADAIFPTQCSSKQIAASTPGPRTYVVDQLLDLLETILREASKQSKQSFRKFCTETCGTVEDIKFSLNSAQILYNRLSHVSHKIIQVLPFLTFGNKEKMSALIDYFRPSIDFDSFDEKHSALNESVIDLFCIMADAIEPNENGNQLKDFLISEAIVSNCAKYLNTHAPPLKSSLLATSEEWKKFTSKPALKYVLRILGGLSISHAATQVLIARDCIPVVHGLEQVSSDARVGSLAENLLEAIKQHPSAAEKIELVRRQTKEEKKRLAMAVRERQLGALGMKANERGQVTARSKLLEECLDLAEDSGLICNICREGYKFQPTKVLGIYTYTKRCVLDEFEIKPRKTYGYTTVTHFNTVHVDCHMSAVRSARGRDEWDSAALQNANTRCNGLLPIWGPQVPESAYANSLARHNSYLQDSTNYGDIGYHSTVHDIRLQLLRFAQERSFSEDTGGGGPQSNLHLVPYMMQTALYVLNSTKAATREYKRTLNYIEMSSNETIENCYDVDSPYYWCTLAVLVLPPTWWKKKRVQFLQRLLVCNHVRRVSIKPPAPMSDTRVRSYTYYKSALLFFAFIDSFYSIVFKDALLEDKWNQDWSATLADYLKNNDQEVNDNIEVLLNLYQNSLLSCTSIERFLEIIRLEEITEPSEFLSNSLESV